MFKSKKGNKFVTDTFHTAKETLKALPIDAKNVKLFKSNNGGIHSHKIHFFATFVSSTCQATEKLDEVNYHNGKAAQFIPSSKWNTIDNSILEEEIKFQAIAWEDGRF